MERTKLSSKGQIVIPKSVRDAHGWTEGTEFAIEHSKDGLLLRADTRPSFPRTTIDQVAGCLKYDGTAKSIEDMKAAIGAEAVRRFRRAVRK